MIREKLLKLFGIGLLCGSLLGTGAAQGLSDDPVANAQNEANKAIQERRLKIHKKAMKEVRQGVQLKQTNNEVPDEATQAKINLKIQAKIDLKTQAKIDMILHKLQKVSLYLSDLPNSSKLVDTQWVECAIEVVDNFRKMIQLHNDSMSTNKLDSKVQDAVLDYINKYITELDEKLHYPERTNNGLEKA